LGYKSNKNILMKTILLTITLALTSLFLNAQSSTEATTEGTTITVNVILNGSGGHVLYSLHNESTFMKEPLEGASSEIKDGKATVTFNNVKPGTYGIMVVHDKNDNKRMDFEPTGMPKEAYGMSNNIMSYGPPQWNDAKFEVLSSPLNIEIRL